MAKALPANRKDYGVILQKAVAVTPSEDDLTLINQHALAPVSAEDVTIVPIRLANTRLDRAYERFTKACLQRLADTIPGKSLMVAHDYSQVPVGRVFEAEVRPDKEHGGHYLFTRAFMSNANPLTADVRLGVVKDASVGFMPSERICDICGKDYDWYYKSAGQRTQADDEPCSHIAGRTYDGRLCTLTYGGDLEQMEALEESLVWLGCQQNAGTSPKSALDAVTKAEHFDALAPAGGKENAMEKELAAALARVKELEAQVKQLEPLADDGTKYRAWQKSEIARLYTSMDDQQAGAALVDAMADADAGKLDVIRAAAAERQTKHFDPRGGAESGGGAVDEPPKPTVRELLWGAQRQGGA